MRHSNSRSSAAVTSSVPAKVNRAVSATVVGPVAEVSGGAVSGAGNGPSCSYAPMSQPVFCGRPTPRWSAWGQGLTPLSMPKLPSCSAWVIVGPPLSAIASTPAVEASTRSRGPRK